MEDMGMKKKKWDIRDRYLNLDDIEIGETFILMADLGQMGKKNQKVKCEKDRDCERCVFLNKILGVKMCMIPLSYACVKEKVIYAMV